ncbi:glutathione S-transferase [Sphingomonas mollis]|uniref:glutathione S-transferase n=1 Tax=Sphingomonas mollis TaxID=2795726 RepID=UPI002FCDF13D
MDTLYSFRRCPYAMRARLALLVGEVPFAIREVTLRHKPAAMIAISPKATVPVLQCADGRVIDQSIDIMRWSLERSDPERWLAGDDMALIDLFDDRFKHHLDRYKYADRHGADPLDHRAAGLALLTVLEKRLSTVANLCGPTRSLADMAIMPFVRQFAAVDPDWFDAQPIPQVRQWLADHLASPLFGRAMERLAPWRPDDPVTLWPSADPSL